MGKINIRNLKGLKYVLPIVAVAGLSHGCQKDIIEPINNYPTPKIEIISPLEGKVYYSKHIHFERFAKGENIKDAWYSVDNGKKKPICKSGITILNFEEGNHKIVFGAENSYSNFSKDSVSFSVEKPAWKYLSDPFARPNDSTFYYYGSGDANRDNSVDSLDVDRMNEVIRGWFSDTSDTRLYDRIDLDGDGKVTKNDVILLEDRLNGTIKYFPGEWNKLKRHEKIGWYMKMENIDWTNTLAYIPLEWICGDFARQKIVNFTGFSEFTYSIKLGLKDNGRFNIPMYFVGVTDDKKSGIKGDNKFGHAINAVLIGDDPGNFYDSYFSDPQADVNVLPGSPSMPMNCKVEIDYAYVKEDPSQGQVVGGTPILEFQVENGVPTTNWVTTDSSIKVVTQRE